MGDYESVACDVPFSVPISEPNVACRFCGRYHGHRCVCPTIKAVRFDTRGLPSRIEFHPPQGVE